MTRRLAVLFTVLVVLIMLYALVLRLAPSPRLSRPAGASAGPGREGEDMPFRPGPYPAEYEEVTVTIDIPPLSQFPPGWAQIDGCPHIRISKTLGVAMGPGNGCPILSVQPGGPAAEAGIQPGDRLGEPSDCSSTLYRSLRPREEPRTIEWTIRRPEAAEQKSPVADPPDAEGARQEASG